MQTCLCIPPSSQRSIVTHSVTDRVLWRQHVKNTQTRNAHQNTHTHTHLLLKIIIPKWKSPLFFSLFFFFFFFYIFVVGVCLLSMLLLLFFGCFFTQFSELWTWMKVKVSTPGSPSLIVLLASVDIKQHSTWTTQFTPQNIYGRKKKRKKKKKKKRKKNLTIYVALVVFIYFAFICQPSGLNHSYCRQFGYIPCRAPKYIPEMPVEYYRSIKPVFIKSKKEGSQSFCTSCIHIQ